MTGRSTGNRQKKMVRPRTARGGEKRVKVSVPRVSPAIPRRENPPQSAPRSAREEENPRE